MVMCRQRFGQIRQSIAFLASDITAIHRAHLQTYHISARIAGKLSEQHRLPVRPFQTIRSRKQFTSYNELMGLAFDIRTSVWASSYCKPTNLDR